MVWVSAQFTLQIYGMDQRSDAAEIPMWIPHVSVAVGFTGLALCALLELRQLLGRRPW
jgi:TRAP-type C4-dicarboxylate transport system permease small subunit